MQLCEIGKLRVLCRRFGLTPFQSSVDPLFVRIPALFDWLQSYLRVDSRAASSSLEQLELHDVAGEGLLRF